MTESENKAENKPLPPKHDWYQTESDVYITLMLKNVPQDNVTVNFTETTVSATVKQASGIDYSMEIDLAHPINPDKCSCRALPSKIEIKMRKVEGFRWAALEGEGKPHDVKPAVKTDSGDGNATGAKSNVSSYPTSSTKGPKNWDKMAKDVEKEETDEKLEGDAAVNKLFRQIYSGASEDAQRAMIKSFYESGGTVLSTNWDEVGKEKVDIKPPDGMEFKKWQ